MKIRLLKNSDYKIVAKLNKELEPVSTIKSEVLSEKELKRMFMSGRTKYFESRIIENSKEEAIGFIYTIYNHEALREKFLEVIDLKNVLYLYCIVIKKSFQNKGYGRLLWKEVEEIAERHNKKDILLEVNNKNAVAYEWYKKLGFTEINSKVWMQKPLNVNLKFN